MEQWNSAAMEQRSRISHIKLSEREDEYIQQQLVNKAIAQSLAEHNIPSEISQIISSMNCVKCIDSLRKQKKGYQMGLTCYVCYKCDDWRNQNHKLLQVD